jgi:hypothetical protein
MARLSNSSNRRVVCRHRSCGEPFGWIVDVSRGEAELAGLPGPGRWLIMEQGWRPRHQDGIWTKQKRQRRGASPTRRIGAPVRWVPVSFPVEAICPAAACGFRQLMEGATLGLHSVSKLEIQSWPSKDSFTFRYSTGRRIGEREAAQLLDRQLNAMPD